MQDPQRSSSSRSSTAVAVLTIVFTFSLVIGGCQKLEKNGTWQSWADEMEKK